MAFRKPVLIPLGGGIFCSGRWDEFKIYLVSFSSYLTNRTRSLVMLLSTKIIRTENTYYNNSRAMRREFRNPYLLHRLPAYHDTDRINFFLFLKSFYLFLEYTL